MNKEMQIYILTAALATKRRTRRSFPSILTECIRLVKNKCLLGVYIEGLSFTIFFQVLINNFKKRIPKHFYHNGMQFM